MPQLHTPLGDRLGMPLPIIQAPMAGRPTTPELVAAVSEAGGPGSFGFAYTQPEAMRRDTARKAGNRVFLSMYAGQAARLTRALPAADLAAQLHAEALEALDHLAALRR